VGHFRGTLKKTRGLNKVERRRQIPPRGQIKTEKGLPHKKVRHRRERIQQQPGVDPSALPRRVKTLRGEEKKNLLRGEVKGTTQEVFHKKKDKTQCLGQRGYLGVSGVLFLKGTGSGKTKCWQLGPFKKSSPRAIMAFRGGLKRAILPGTVRKRVKVFQRHGELRRGLKMRGRKVWRSIGAS